MFEPVCASVPENVSVLVGGLGDVTDELVELFPQAAVRSGRSAASAQVERTRGKDLFIGISASGRRASLKTPSAISTPEAAPTQAAHRTRAYDKLVAGL